MTLTLDVSPETEAWLKEDAEQSLVADWQALSYRALWEVWDNESDSIYDKL